MVLQVDLLIPHTIDALVTQGCPNSTDYIESMKLLISNDSRTYETVTDPETGEDQV